MFLGDWWDPFGDFCGGAIDCPGLDPCTWLFLSCLQMPSGGADGGVF